MVFVIPLSVQEKQERSLTMPNLDMFNFGSYHRLKTNINRLFAWFDRFRFAHYVIFMVFAQSDLWLPVMNVHSGVTLGSSFSGINVSSMNRTDYEQAYAKRCSLPPGIPIDSYISMKKLNFFLYAAAMLLLALMNFVYLFISSYYSSRYFNWNLNLFILLIISTICNQLVSAFACRSIDILSDIRFTSMIFIQIFGFIVCLFFAFLLGIKYASLNHAS